MPQVIKKMSPEQIARWNYRWERKGLYGGTAIQEFLPKWVHGDYLKPEFLEQTASPGKPLSWYRLEILPARPIAIQEPVYEYTYKASADSEARVALFYWPGWELSIDGKLQSDNVRPDDNGLISNKSPGRNSPGRITLYSFARRKGGPSLSQCCCSLYGFHFSLVDVLSMANIFAKTTA